MKKQQIKFIYKHYFKESIYDFLKKKKYSDSNIYHLIKNKNIKVNGQIITTKWFILPSFKSIIEITLNDEISSLDMVDNPIDIVYEDKYILIVNKPANLDIEPTKANYDDNLATYINYYFKSNGIKSKIHFINRLDKVTKGLVIVAKNQYIHHLFSFIKINKKYKALVEGKTNYKGSIKVKIKKSDTIKRIVDDEGKLSITKYKTLSYSNNKSVVDIKLITGRTHQIRVSFAHINHPLVNDCLYNPNVDSVDDFSLTCYHMVFKHPITNKKMKFYL